MKNRRSIVLIATSLLAQSAGSKPIARLSPTPPHAVSAAEYALHVSHLFSCDDLFERIGSIAQANTLLKNIPNKNAEKLDSNGRLNKGEFENTADFKSREDAFWTKALGDSRRIIIDIKVAPSEISFDADLAEVTVNLPVFQDRETTGLVLDTVFPSTGDKNYTATNGFGASVSVHSFWIEQRRLEVDSSSIARLSLAKNGPTKLLLALNSDRARYLKQNAHLLV